MAHTLTGENIEMSFAEAEDCLVVGAAVVVVSAGLVVVTAAAVVVAASVVIVSGFVVASFVAVSFVVGSSLEVGTIEDLGTSDDGITDDGISGFCPSVVWLRREAKDGNVTPTEAQRASAVFSVVFWSSLSQFLATHGATDKRNFELLQKQDTSNNWQPSELVYCYFIIIIILLFLF